MDKHAIKIEELNTNMYKADQILDALKEFLLELNFKEERIENLECRRRDGFSPHSFNKGGLSAIAFMDSYYARSTGRAIAPNTDITLEKHYGHDIELYEKEIDKKNKDWTESDQENFNDYCMEGEGSVLFGCDLMLTSDTELNIRLTVSAKDSPYHRYYDDLYEFEIEFKTIKGLRTKLNKILQDKNIKHISQTMEYDCY